MTYNLRPRRASVALRGAAPAETRRSGQAKTQLNSDWTQDKEGTQIRANDIAPPEVSPLQRGKDCSTAALTPTGEGVPQGKQSTTSFPSTDDGFPSKSVVEEVAEQRHYNQHTLSTRTRHNGTMQRMTSRQMAARPIECTVRSPEVTMVDRMMPAAYFLAKDSPPRAPKDSETLAIRPERKTSSSANIRSTRHYVPTTSSCHPLLVPPVVGTGPKSDSVCKAVGVCHSEQVQSLCLPRVQRHCYSATAVPPPHFRVSGTAPHTPARSKKSSDVCPQDLGQAGCSSVVRKYSATALRHNGETESTRLFVLLSSSTVMTPSASRGRKRKREYSKSRGVSYKKKGLSPQSPSIRTRTTASTVPSPSDLASPPSILLPLVSPATDRQPDCAAVSLTARGLTLATPLYDEKPPCTTPPVPVEDATEVPPSTKRCESLPDNLFNPDFPFTDRNLSPVESPLKQFPTQPVTSTGYGAPRSAVDLLQLKRHAPDAACATDRGTSAAAALPESPIRLNDKAYSISTVSSSCSARTAAILHRRPLRVRWKGRRRGTQPSASLQQGEDTQQESMLSISRSLSQTQPGESHRAVPAALQACSRSTSPTSRAACDGLGNEATGPSNVLPAGRERIWLTSDAQCQQCCAGGDDATVTRVTAPPSCQGLHSSATLEVCNFQSERLSREKTLSQDVLTTVKRLQQATNSKQIRSRPGADSSCRASHADCDVPSGIAHLAASPCFHVAARQCSVFTGQGTLTCQRPSGARVFSSPSLLHAAGKSLLFRSLPPVILCRVLRFLPLSSLAAFGATCTYAQELLRLPATWKYLDERSVGRWMWQRDRLPPHLSACRHSEQKQDDAVPNKAEASQTTSQQISWDIAAAAEPFACLSSISVDLTYARGLSQTRSVSQALFNLPAAAQLRFTPAHIGRNGVSHVTTVREVDGIRRTAPNAPAQAAVTHTFSRLSGRSASPSIRSSAFHQYSSPLGAIARPAGTAINRLNEVVPVQQVQSVNEGWHSRQPPHTGTRRSAVHGDGTVDWQRHGTTPSQGVANGLSETQAGAQAQQQAPEGSLACNRGGERSDSSVQGQRERLIRTLTLLLCSHMSTSTRSGRLAVASYGLHEQNVYANREPLWFSSPSAVEAGVRLIHNSQSDEEAASLPGASAALPSALTSERRWLRSHVSVEEDSFPVREIGRRAPVESTGFQQPALLQNLCAQVATPESFFQAWSRERQHFIREIQNRGAAVVPTTQQQEYFDHARPFSGFSFRIDQLLGTREESVLNKQPESEAEQTAIGLGRASQIVSVSGNEQGSIIEVPEASGRTWEQLQGQPVSRRDRHRLFFLHQLLLRLQQPQQLSEGHQLRETAVLIPRLFARQNSLSNLPSAAEEGANADEEGCPQQIQRCGCGLAREMPSSQHWPQNEVDMRERQPRVRQAQQQSSEEITGQRNRSQTPNGYAEVSGQSMQRLYRSSVCLTPVDAGHGEGATNTSTGHSQPLGSVPRILVSTQMDQQCASDPSQLGGTGSACALPHQCLVTASQSRRGTQEGAPSSEQLASNSVHFAGEMIEERSTTDAEQATENSCTNFRENFVAKEGDSEDTQRLRILRSLLVHMQQLVQINFRLEARELNRLQRLHEEVLAVTSLLRQNATTLRLIKISVDLIAVEGGAEEVINRSSESRNSAETSLTLPLLELPQCLPALQVFHTDYPFQVPSGFSASPSFTQLCVRSLHRFLSPFFTTDAEPTQPKRKRANTASSDSSRSASESRTSRANVSLPVHGVRVRRGSAEQRMYTVDDNQRHVERDSRGDINHKVRCTTQATGQTGERADACASPELALQRFDGDAQFSCLSPRTRPRQERVSQIDRVDTREQHTVLSLRLSHPLLCRRVSLPDLFTTASETEFSTDQEGKEHGGVHIDTEEEASFEEMAEAQAGLRRRQVLRVDDLGLSPCHTLSPQSDVALSLQSSPSGETREDLVRHLREAFTERIAKDVPENEARASCDGKNEFSKGAPGSYSLDRLDVHSMAASNDIVSSSPPTIPIREKPDDICCNNSENVPAISDDAPVRDHSRGNRERGHHEAPPRTPLANLQRLLHIGRETLQQVDLQGDPPRTFCCLHSRLKFSKLRRLSLGWTCTAELALLHSMLSKGHLPQLRKLQFSGPSGGSGLSMMHLQLYALLNSPPSTCPHHPSVPLPETISLASPTSSHAANLPPLPLSSAIAGASVDFKSCERVCEARRQTKAFSQSENSGEQRETLPMSPRTATVATVTASLQDDKVRLQGMHCVLNASDSVQWQQRSAEINSRTTELFADQAEAAYGEHVARRNILVEQPTSRRRAGLCAGEVDGQFRGSDGAGAACEKQGHTQEFQQNASSKTSTSAALTALQVLNKNKSGAPIKRRSLRFLACTLASAKEASIFGCKMCAAMRGGTAHGVYFKYAALDIDFAALIEFRLALQRHGLFAFYKDERNKLNLLHVEGLTDVAGRDALEEEKSLENRLERKNEWKRRFAYLHIQSPPFSFSSASQSNSRHATPHSRTDPSSEGLLNAALWSVAPLPSCRAASSESPSTAPRGLLTSGSRSSHSESIKPTLLDHHAALETGTREGGTTGSGRCLPPESSTARMQRSPGPMRSVRSASAAEPAVYLTTDSGRLGAATATVLAEEEAPATTPTIRGGQPFLDPSLDLIELTPSSGSRRGQNFQETSGNLLENQTPSGRRGSGSGPGHRLELSRAPLLPRNEQASKRACDSELQTEQNPRASGPSTRPSSSALDHQEIRQLTRCIDEQVGTCACLNQETVQGEAAAQIRYSQEQRHHIRSVFTLSSSADVTRSLWEAARRRGNSGEMCVVRRDFEDSKHCSTKDGNDCLSNCPREGTAFADPEVTGGSLSAQAESDNCRTTLKKKEGGEPRSGNEATVTCSQRAAGPSACQPHDTDENSIGGFRISDEGETGSLPCQNSHLVQWHNQSRRQQRRQPQTGGAVPRNAPLRPRSGEYNKQAAAGREEGRLPKAHPSHKPYFPEVCPLMSGRDLFILEMWLAPELCRDLQPAPNLSQLSKQLTYLWEHKLTAQQRAVYNDVIVKRYVQERQGVQEWNFDTAKAWWMGG